MFSEKEIQCRNRNFLGLIRNSYLIVLSSFDALKDMKKFAPNYEDKARVLQFVSQPNSRYFELDEHDRRQLLKKYEIKDDFFYIPNQFWKHKNHMMIFETISELKKDGIEINIVCTGYLGDYRNKTYIDDAREFIKSNNLEDNIKLLGLVDYEDVFALIKFSKAVINPSLFEGWSSTVEECKSVGKNMILSDLDVHKEQYPSAVFFERNSIESLKEVLKFYKIENGSNVESFEVRTKKFANTYALICREILAR